MMKTRILLSLSLIIAAVLPGCRQKNAEGVFSADVVIYGGTSAAVTAAVQVHRMGLSVIVVSPDTHLGGMSSSGLGFTDTGNKEVIGGLAREFYQLIYNHYENPGSWNWQSALNTETGVREILPSTGKRGQCGYSNLMLQKLPSRP